MGGPPGVGIGSLTFGGHVCASEVVPQQEASVQYRVWISGAVQLAGDQADQAFGSVQPLVPVQSQTHGSPLLLHTAKFGEEQHVPSGAVQFGLLGFPVQRFTGSVGTSVG